MLIVVRSYALFNIKILLKDKVPLLWSIVLPVITFFLNYQNITNEWELAYWWVYIISCSYIYGVGIYALQLKETGSLKTIFSINNSPWAFFLGNLITQVLFSLISISILNSIVFLITSLSPVKLLIYSLITIVACIPIAFLSYNITLIKRIHANTIQAIFTILIFGLFILLNTNSAMNQYNPLLLLANLLIKHEPKALLIYVIVALILMSISMYSIVKFESASNERR